MQQQLAKSVAGNFTVMFALILFPITSVAGLAIDYRAAVNAQTKVQSIVDQALLSTAKIYRDPSDEDEAQTYINGLISQQLRQLPIQLSCADAALSVPDDDRQVEVTIACKKTAELMQVFGIDEIDFTVTATATWGVDKLEVVFVLDMSHSMAPNIADLQGSMGGILDALLPETGTPPVEDTRIGIVTFSSFFNAGDLFEAATGMKPRRTYFFEDNYIDEDGNEATVTRERVMESTCVVERLGDHAYTDAAPNHSPPGELPIVVPEDRIDAELAPGETAYQAARLTLAPTEANPYGFVAAPFAVGWDNPSREDKRFFEVPGNRCNDLGPVPLTDNRAHLNEYVEDLYADGFTSGHQGLAWGWYLLSEKWSDFLPSGSKPAAYDDLNTMKAIIFFTDGLMDVGFPWGDGTGDPQARKICANIKSTTNIRVFAIGYSLSGTRLNLVNECATEPDYAFAADSEEDLTSAFDDIVNSLTNLRISS